jgi:hypothetical protein
MKKAILLISFLLGSCALATAQQITDSTYVSQNGTTFKVGQSITLGLGSGTDGIYKYIHGINYLGFPDLKDNLPPEYATKSVVIYKIKKQKSGYFVKDYSVYLVFKVQGNLENYGINIEPALLAKEVSIPQ